MTTEGSINTCA